MHSRWCQVTKSHFHYSLVQFNYIILLHWFWFNQVISKSLFEYIKGWWLLHKYWDIVSYISTVYFETRFTNIQSCIRNMKVIGLACVMTMYTSVPLEEFIKYFGDIIIDALVHKYASHVIINIINREYSSGKHKGLCVSFKWCTIYYSYHFFRN